MTEQTISDKLEQMDDTEEGEILEDGEIQDEEETISSTGDYKTFEQKGLNAEEKENNNYRDKGFRDKDSRKREERKSEDRNRDKDKDRRSERDRDRDRRDRYDRNDRHERSDRSERKRKSSSTYRERSPRPLHRDKRPAIDRQGGPTGTRTALNRSQERQTPFKQICKYFLDGKCHKGADCPFSHDANPPKKKELCKFYLQGFCGKGEDCLFMHSEFPCKFFHTNVECYSGDNCRFSHSPLTEDTREILRNYLDSGTLPDDPKPERQHRHSDIDTNKESHNQNNLTSIDSQTNSEPNCNPSGTFTPIKPVAKRHALLGDPTQEMKTCHLTWVWQQEMKELEDAYVGNKRNLFCIEKPFVITEKPSTPRMEDDEEEIEAQIRNYYRDTMPEFEADVDHRKTNSLVIEEQKLIEASAHDEDLRTLMVRPRSHTNESIGSLTNNDFEEKSPKLVVNEESQSAEVPQNLPKVARDLYLKMQNKVKTESEVKPIECQSDSDDDDDKNVLAAALKNVQQSFKQSPTDKISQMLSIIRNSSNPFANQSPQQTEFWHNLMGGIHIPGVTASPSSNSTPPRTDFRDPRLKRGKESMSPSVEKTPPVKICDPNVKIEYKLVPIKANDIDYSTYVSIYRIDARLKNDPRLQKFFSKLPSSEIDNLSRIVPPPLKTAPVTPLCVLKSMQKAEKERQKDLKDRTESPTLPPLPPLTISPTKSTPTPGIRPPTPPPIMSPLELISSSISSSNNLFRL